VKRLTRERWEQFAADHRHAGGEASVSSKPVTACDEQSGPDDLLFTCAVRTVLEMPVKEAVR
jgi:hypothetical protein